jgi:hypothetical protein
MAESGYRKNKTSIKHLLTPVSGRESTPERNEWSISSEGVSARTMQLRRAIGRSVVSSQLTDRLQDIFRDTSLTLQPPALVFVNSESVKIFARTMPGQKVNPWTTDDMIQTILTKTDTDFAAELRANTSTVVQSVGLEMLGYDKTNAGVPKKKRYELGLRISRSKDSGIAAALKEERHECNRVLFDSSAPNFGESLAISLGRLTCAPAEAYELRQRLQPFADEFPAQLELGPLSSLRVT